MTPLIDAEQWLPIMMYEDLYEVSNMGRVRSKDRSHLLVGRHRAPYRRTLKGRIKAVSESGAYDVVNLYCGGKCKGYLVHRLVAIHFVPNPDNLPEVNHKDEDKKNNAWCNLEWMTSAQNSLHSCHKTTGSKCGTSKLSEEDVVTIADLLISKELKQTEIAKMYGVSPHAILRIKAGDNWAWLTGFGKEGTRT